jgi:cyclophilin family peptidyl-prolyl cis-trans isomerase
VLPIHDCSLSPFGTSAAGGGYPQLAKLKHARNDPLRYGPAIADAVLHTNHGAIEVELHDTDAPTTVANFRKLAGDGFYDGLVFHRVIPDFMIQGGDPKGDGTGGPGYTFKDEQNEHRIVRGALAMANAGPNTNGSQFFIVTAEAAPWLDGKHTVFGRVTSGMEAVDAISSLPRDARDRPRDDAVIERVELRD